LNIPFFVGANATLKLDYGFFASLNQQIQSKQVAMAAHHQKEYITRILYRTSEIIAFSA
jgi:hypothetical protein